MGHCYFPPIILFNVTVLDAVKIINVMYCMAGIVGALIFKFSLLLYKFAN